MRFPSCISRDSMFLTPPAKRHKTTCPAGLLPLAANSLPDGRIIGMERAAAVCKKSLRFMA
jgi:hypothetical protein